MKLQRTPRLKLDTTTEQERALRQTSPQYKQAKQYALDIAWEHGDEPKDKITSKNRLDDLVYDDLCKKTDLQTGHVQLARDQAVQTVDAMVEQFYNPDEPNPSKPEYSSPVVNYGNRTLSFLERNGEQVASLATVEGRVYPELELPESNNNPQEWYFESDEWEWTTATLTRDGGDFYLNVTCEKQVSDEELQTENGMVLGVDLNVTGPFIATSTGEFIGSADKLNHWRNEYEKTRGNLQECGTQSAHRTVQSVSGSFTEKSEQWLHKRANELVEHAVERGVDGIVFEDLDAIRERMSDDKKFQQWAFGRIVELVTYKAKEHEIFVDDVPSEYTSQECSRCGFVSRDNLDGKRLCCIRCGRSVHRDYDAAVSVAIKYVRLHSSQTCSNGGVSVNAALKSGTLDSEQDAVCSVQLSSLTSPMPQRATKLVTSGGAK
jgi:putative transposase